MPLEREQALRRAEAAKRAVRRRVGRHRAAAQPHVRAEVRPGGVNGAARQHDRRQRAVRAAVDHEVDVHREQPSVARRPPCGAASATDGAWSSPPCPRRGRRSIFTGPSRLPRQQRRVAGDDRRVFLLAAEAAAGLHLHDADLVCRQVEQRARAPCGCSTGTASSPTPSRRLPDSPSATMPFGSM